MLLTPKRSNDVKARIQTAVETALKARDISARRASLDVVGNDGLIRDIRAGRLPGVDRLEALFEYLGLEFYFGSPRSGIDADAVMKGPNGESSASGFVAIAWHSLSPRPPGRINAPVALSREWLAAIALDPADLAAVMLDPTSAAVLLVDPSASQKDGPALWCYREGGRVAVGRIQFEAGMTIFLPDTRDGKARVLQGDDRAKVTFLGRVVWPGELLQKP